uniref:Uncharacterized protein n=1 Tax=Nelumbo nucifera TaxID=4432 RepID=A0A822XQJ5_NELNU|nr:TPA_asm: hypothetical protein HUJ06_024163 [Nelumbo nucifera]
MFSYSSTWFYQKKVIHQLGLLICESSYWLKKEKKTTYPFCYDVNYPNTILHLYLSLNHMIVVWLNC